MPFIRTGVLYVASLIAFVEAEGSAELVPAAPLQCRDTLQGADDDSADAQECLQGLSWPVQSFEACCEAGGSGRGDVTIRFPSPFQTSPEPPGGVNRNNMVTLEGYIARDATGEPLRAPAVVVVHESGSGMTVGRLIARSLPAHRVHAFLIHLPYYGDRRGERQRPDAANIVAVVRQAAADVRRARDAVVALPCVDPSHVALQGTSLGGIVAAIAGSLDTGYDSVHLLLAGGDLFDVIENGREDAARFREELSRIGLKGEGLRAALHAIEPTRIAHRLQPSRTWLYSADYDTVIPPRNGRLLAEAAGLGESHHIRLAADHYSGIIYLPFVLKRIAQSMEECGAQLPQAPRAAGSD